MENERLCNYALLVSNPGENINFHQDLVDIINNTGYFYSGFNFTITKEKRGLLKTPFLIFFGNKKRILGYEKAVDFQSDRKGINLTEEHMNHMSKRQYARNPLAWNADGNSNEYKVRTICKIIERKYLREPLNLEGIKNWEGKRASYEQNGFELILLEEVLSRVGNI